mmetsp:Transcript_58796/g.156467  ORF Transcript_58796/g.156467 Transcript_58796/m.156467 type:complete len:107 (-) Transcript_58796:259-579(-)
MADHAHNVNDTSLAAVSSPALIGAGVGSHVSLVGVVISLALLIFCCCRRTRATEYTAVPDDEDGWVDPVMPQGPQPELIGRDESQVSCSRAGGAEVFGDEAGFLAD